MIHGREEQGVRFLPVNKRVVIVDDDILIAMHLKDLCEQAGTNVVGMAHTSRRAHTLIVEKKPDYVIMDLRLEGERDGVDIAMDVRQLVPDMKIIFVTGEAGHLEIARIESAQPERVMMKPVTGSDIKGAFS